MIPNDTIPNPAQQESSTHTNPVVMETKQSGTVTAIRPPQLNLQIPDDLQRQTGKLDDRDEILEVEQQGEVIPGMSQTSTPLTFTVTATRPPVLLKPDELQTVQFKSTTQAVPDSTMLQHSDSTTASPPSPSSSQSSRVQTIMQDSQPTTTMEQQTTSATRQSERTFAPEITTIPLISSPMTSQTEDINSSNTESTTLPPKSVEIVNIIPPKQTTQPTPVTLNFIYNRHTPPSSPPPPPSTSPSTTPSSTLRTTSRPKVRTPAPNPVPPKPVPSYDVLTTPRAITVTPGPTTTQNSTIILAPGGPPMAEAAAGVMGLGSGAEIGIAAGSIVAFWLLLGPLVCLICRLRERAAKTRSGGGVEDSALTRSGDDELGHRLVEEMIRLELARGRHKLYKTNIQDEHETQRLGDVGSEYVNTDYLHNIVQNDYAKNSMERRDSCEKLPLCNGALKEPLYENTSKVPPPPPPPPPPKLDTSPMYANTTVDSPQVPRASNGYVCSNNYPLSSAALHLARQNHCPPTNILRSPESEPVDGFMYSPRLLQRQLERAVRAEQKLHLKDGIRRSEKIFPKENFNIRAEPKIHTKAGLVNGYSKLPTNLPKVSIEGSIPNSPRIMHKDITEEEEEEEEETEIDRNLPKSMSLSHSVERSIPLLNGEKYRITSSNPSIDSGKYMICNKTPSRTRSMERNGLKRIDLNSVDRNGSDPWKKPLRQNGIDARKSRENSVDDTCSSLSSSPPSEEPEIRNNAKKLCDQGTQTLVDTISSPWIGYRRPGVKDTVV